MNESDKTSQEPKPAEMPETMVINGVTYVRASNFVDEQVNSIRSYQTIAERTGLSVKQAIWFRYRNDRDCIMPD